MASVREIARQANVSPGTVSRVLNDDPSLSVSQATRDKINRIAQQLNYTKQARQSRQIQIVTHASKKKEMADPYYRELRLAIEQEVKALNLTLKKTIRTGDVHSFEVLEEITKAGGVIVIGPFEASVIQKLYDFNSNLVLINQLEAPRHIDAVSSDLYSAMFDVLDELNQRQFSRICYIGGETKIRQIGNQHLIRQDIRLKAFKEWSHQHEIEPNYYTTDWNRESAQNIVTIILSQKAMPEVIIAGNDMLAVGLLQELQYHHYKIPEQVKIVSFNDSEIAQYTVPMLTSVRIPIEEFGRQAVKLIQDRMKYQRKVGIHMVLDTSIHYRGSLPLNKKEN